MRDIDGLDKMETNRLGNLISRQRSIDCKFFRSFVHGLLYKCSYHCVTFLRSFITYDCLHLITVSWYFGPSWLLRSLLICFFVALISLLLLCTNTATHVSDLDDNVYVVQIIIIIITTRITRYTARWLT